jgi:hypothetical protein
VSFITKPQGINKNWQTRIVEAKDEGTVGNMHGDGSIPRLDQEASEDRSFTPHNDAINRGYDHPTLTPRRFTRKMIWSWTVSHLISFDAFLL